MGRYANQIKWLLLLAFLAGLAYFQQDTLGAIAAAARQLPVPRVLLALALSTGFFLLEGEIVRLLASGYRESFSYRHGLACAYYCAFYRLLTLGAGTGLAEIHYLHRHKLPLSKATGMAMVQYTQYKIGIAAYGTLCYLLLYLPLDHVLRPYRTYIGIGILITVLIASGLIAVSVSCRLSALLFGLLRKAAGNREKTLARVGRMEAHAAVLHSASVLLLKDRRKLLQLFLLNTGKLSCWYLIPAVLLSPATGAGLLEMMALMAVCNMLAGVLPAPSGIGSLEFTFFLLFGSLGGVGALGSAILMYRFLTWMLPFAIGTLVLGAQKKSPRPHSSSKAPV
ncbi:lysylphosphatidylglycerol synthase transmembrane domain-containing protein [Anaerotalea alkaliphila]|uniref:Phosphatidylglycerol lysyltransferase n=1 Tax=Anaerotalea alkaliphila TaxID=2662126 RepID=A0A7X5HXH0_9FIRM|nr:lysylphosphatidylglycerol synthase transmembrane domain-containing protein [Anaerotalea alkaliphila]NDL68415.1 flippase-like domain-containing protein [Anaerotalea alkaliphila]